MPEKSGVPLGVRGAGALRFGLPSAVLGTPAVGYFNHCADTVAHHARAAPTAMAMAADRSVLCITSLFTMSVCQPVDQVVHAELVGLVCLVERTEAAARPFPELGDVRVVVDDGH